MGFIHFAFLFLSDGGPRDQSLWVRGVFLFRVHDMKEKTLGRGFQKGRHYLGFCKNLLICMFLFGSIIELRGKQYSYTTALNNVRDSSGSTTLKVDC